MAPPRTPSKFDIMLRKVTGAAQARKMVRASMGWYQKKVQQYGRDIRSRDLLAADDRKRKDVFTGRMYFFAYDAKWKRKLPYWDRYPLIFPIEMYQDGFLGINFHYLNYHDRAGLMDALQDLSTDSHYTQITKLRISYDILVAASAYKAFKPCVHRYLSDHVRSPFIRIESYEWDAALFLPVARFEKQSEAYVWSQSRAQY